MYGCENVDNYELLQKHMLQLCLPGIPHNSHTRFSLFQSLTKMVDRIRKFQILNDQIFAIVNVHLYESASQAIVAPTAVKHFDPPSPDVKFTVPEELSQQSEI